MHVASLPGFSITVFSQCAFGLKTPMGKPMKKETALLSNIPAVHALFKKEGRCKCQVQHKHCVGSENGVKLSRWAHHYPRNMCVNLICAFKEHILDMANPP